MASMKSPLGKWSVHWRWPWKPPRMALCPRASSPQSSSARRGLPTIRSRAISVILTTVSQSRSFCGTRTLLFGRVVFAAFRAVGFCPGQGALEFIRVVNAFFDAAGDLGHVDRLDPHAQVAFEKALVHDGTGDAHRNAPDARGRICRAAWRRPGRPGQNAIIFPAHRQECRYPRHPAHRWP